MYSNLFQEKKMADKKEPINPIIALFVILFLVFVCVTIVISFIVALATRPSVDEKHNINIDKNGTSKRSLKYKVITLKDGKNIECVRFVGSQSGISCNWNNPIQLAAPSYYIGYQLNKE